MELGYDRGGYGGSDSAEIVMERKIHVIGMGASAFPTIIFAQRLKM